MYTDEINNIEIDESHYFDILTGFKNRSTEGNKKKLRRAMMLNYEAWKNAFYE